ncbi:NAD-dependent DNA ligase LigA [Salarchaeum sp. JOR-1]|uniref:NAD-dependent DNA ligase LigA n=1 Tax=Salarchaeum sp. JOR-1 TaxID=2599399 RepID=UPI0011984A8F|nr:NAD-dependent DNA ligase LigA [Salarchaeum sp. JOR-1]QDX40264.1 NAD-dependent DNA ligase LigA [Salarchaeum sp. JOR-1]
MSDAAFEGLEGAGDLDPENPYITNPNTEFRDVDSLTESEAEEQVADIREAVRFHDYRYYVLNDPVVSDRAYDRLFERLQELENVFGLQTEDSPTQRVGGEPVDELGTVEHVAPMLSIDSSGDEADVRAFDERVRRTVDGDVQYVCEPKFDGLSIEIVYEDGRYVRAATRGDGERGEDVTENVRTIESVPARLRGDHPDFLAVRGEVYMPREAFQEHNKERVQAGEEPFANPRNAAAGTLRQLDPSVTAERPLDCFFYDILAAGESEGDVADATASRGALGAADLDTHWIEHERFPDWGLKVNDRTRLVDGIEDAIAYRNELQDAREDLNYEIDGVVFKVNSRAQCADLGTTSRHYRWAYAYKFPARSETTRITDIIVQVGRTGRLTPVALLEPVDVAGVTVSRASLHNQDEIAEMDVNVGDEVRVERAGEVIPYVDEVVEKHADGHFEMPEACPVCGSETERRGPLHYCTGGLACPAQLKRSVEYFASDDGLDIDGLGAEAAEQFVEEGLVEHSVADLYELTVDDIAELDGWGEPSAKNLVDELDGSRNPSLAEFIAAIGIPEVGPTIARDLARHFGGLDAVLDASEDDLREVDGVGETVAGEIREFVENERNREVIERLRERGVTPHVESEDTGSELEGLTVVFTGSVEGWTRDELEAIVEEHGGNATGSVSSNTDYLVVGDNPGTTKREDADAAGVPELSPEEFFELLSDHGIDT